MPSEPRWRVIPAIGDPVPFRTELAARTAAAIRSRDGRAPAVVEYLDHRGRWRPAGPSAAELYAAAKARNAADARTRRHARRAG